MINLKRLEKLKKYSYNTGFSDHTIGVIASIKAITMGAKIIEKHFILDRSIGGPDSTFSMNEQEFTSMVRTVREAERAIGSIDYSLTESQFKGKAFSRSLYVVEDVKVGEVISEKNVRSIRPGFGLHPKYLKSIIGREFNCDLLRGSRLSLDMIK